MPVPLPTDAEVDLEPPGRDEVETIARGVGTAAAGPGGLTDVQRLVLDEVTEAMTGIRVESRTVAPMSAEEFARALARRDREFRTRMVQFMMTLELILVPLPPEVTRQVEEYAAQLGVADEMMRVARRLAKGSLGLALEDFNRSGYFEELVGYQHPDGADALADVWEKRAHDPELAARWAALEHCPEGSLGQGVWRFYTARGFSFPGLPQSAPPTLAQHDWIHVLADYGSTVESEIEVFGLISRANDDPRGYTLLAMVLGLFETGYLYGAAKGFFEYDRGHLSRDAGRMAVRLADALRRGALAGWHMQVRNPDGTAVDLLAVDWFEYADLPVEQVREIFSIVDRSERAIAAGSVTPWEPGGISPFQLECGRAAAEARGRPYESFGAQPA